MVNVLALVLLHDEHLVVQTVEAALKLGQPPVQHALNYLSRLNYAPPPVPLKPPTTLTLVIDSLANTARYDH